MNEFILACMSSFWLGILTSISPCPLATNIAAISFVGRRIVSPLRVFIAGLLYTVGRMLAYVILGFIMVSSLLSTPTLSAFLQKSMNSLLGPILVLTGMFMLDILSFTPRGSEVSERLQKRVEAMGLWGTLALGIVFALSFCPLSAALFFGGCIAFACQYNSPMLIPSIYGIATGLPVLLFAVLIAAGTGAIARAYNNLSAFERWARCITGSIVLAVGIYYCLRYSLRLF